MQLALDFEPGLPERYPSLLDACRAAVYASVKPMKSIAGDMDLSQSDLSRKLSGNPDDPRRLSVDEMVRVIEITGDCLPIYWLIERFLESADSKQARALADLAKLMPQFNALMKTLQK